MNTLLVDNYDSYTYNVFQLLAGVTGEEPIVIQNDTVSWGALSRWDFDAIVISPGPGRPERWHDFGVCQDILRWSDIPILGICLGHQGLGHLLEGTVASAPMAMHGRVSHVRHIATGLFAGIPQNFSVVRYHSLAVTGRIGPEGRVTAWTADGVVMGIEHTRRPMWGVQFHPESVSTEYGRRLIENFYTLAGERRRVRPPGLRKLMTPAKPPRAERPREGRVRLGARSVEGEPECEHVFERLFGGAEHAFWLDSADAPTSLAQRSFMGTSAGAERCLLEYDVSDTTVTVHRAQGSTRAQGSIFEVLAGELTRCALTGPSEAGPGLIGGFVGYLGYECKADCGSPNVHRSDMPDAMLMLANRVIAVDHLRGRTHIYTLSEGEDPEAERWLEQAEAVVREALALPLASVPCDDGEDPAATVSFHCGRGRRQYLADIARCQQALAEGESYEVCLTDQISTSASPEAFQLYRVLRRSNPAPFAAYLKLGERAVVSSSPERFLSIDRDRRVQARPIKGTASRCADPARDEAVRAALMSDEKTFAEHLMIVDLLRNDLGRVCEVDSVRVSELMVGERYRTVHQIVSTIGGLLSPNRTPVDCVRACFPGGSMTGAPKLRTMEIIDGIEREARGVYSGALGYFGADGSVDLSIVIRTIVMRPGRTTIGAGGAIVTQSQAAEEFDELLLKARAPMAAIARTVTGGDGPEAWTVELEPAGELAGAGAGGRA